MNRKNPGKTGTHPGLFFIWPLMLVLVTSAASAAELRGRVWDAKTKKAPNRGSLELSCGGNPNPHPLVGNGSYSIRNVPNGTCKITVSTSGGKASRTITINKPVVQFNGETRKAGNKIFLVPR
ncbi:MAG: hypothetical protein R3351_02535 [Nitrospirales bacterium]|nr:hypothetical protein [Nitrospirales bacterium]